VALVAGAAFVWHQRRTENPLVDARLFAGRNVRLALVTNFVVGAALVIAMVDVPLFVNAVEGGLERSALIAGWVLAVLTASMAVTSYVGGRMTERTWYGPPAVAGLVLATVAYTAMGFGWDGETSYLLIGLELAVLGAGFGLTVAPTNSAVISAAPAEQRGSAAALVMVTRLLGFSVGLSALTAWGLSRFNSLRRELDLPPITDPGFADAVRVAQEDLTSTAIAETFLATAVVTVIGVCAAVAMRRPRPDEDHEHVAVITADEPITIDQAGAPMQSWLHRYLAVVLGAFAVLLVGAFVFIGVLLSRLDETKNDLQRVEAGSALFASQVTGFQAQLAELAPQVSEGLDEAIAGLESFGTSTIQFDVPIDENIQIDTEVVIDREIEVPIKTTLPINESFDTTIEIDGPFGVDIPLDVTVPVNIDVPIDLNVTIPINETVPIAASVPVKLTVPINVNVSETELAELTKSLAAGLRSLKEILAGLGG
jgi:MFS family permease